MSQDNDMIRSEGRTVEEAVSEALLHLGARKEEVEITVIEEGKSGLFGVLGRKAACVEVRLVGRKRSRRRGGRGRRRGGEEDGAPDQRNAAASGGDRQGRNRQDQEQRGRGRGGRNEPRRDEPRRDEPRRDEPRRNESRGDEPRREEARRDGARREEPRRESRSRNDRPASARQDGDAQPTREPRQRQERPRRDARPRDDRPRDEQPREASPGNERQVEVAAAQAPRRDRDGDNQSHREPRERRPRGRDGRRDEPINQPVATKETAPMHEERNESPRPTERPAATVLTGDPLAALEMASVLPAVEGANIDETIARTAEDLLLRCGIYSRAQVSMGEDGYRNVRMVTDANSADIMAGRRNSVISSVQHLCDRIATRVAGEHVKINVDINNYRQRSDGGLSKMAEGAINRVKETGEPLHLDPMNARERRIVHMEVAEVEGVDTTTVGEGPDRHVVIIPAGATVAPEEQSGE